LEENGSLETEKKILNAILNNGLVVASHNRASIQNIEELFQKEDLK
jgi:hypothetical protein